MDGVLKHVGIIVDGNGRWAKSQGKSRSEGHLAGSNNLEKLIVHISNTDLKYLSLYVFSNENFKRDIKEVSYLMNLFVKMFKHVSKKYKDYNIKIIFSGRRDKLPINVLKEMDKLTRETKDNTGLVVNFCLNYSSHLEIIDAIKKIQKDNLKIEELNEDIMNKYLYQDLPPIDLLIRTSGEQRLSNFMLWQLYYAELFFTKTYFPDFTGKEYDSIIEDFYKRNRRFGGV